MGILVEKLKKTFEGKEVLGGLSLGIEAGTIAAILGPNGSGKSTLLNILSGVLQKDAGILSLGCKPFELSYIFQNYRESLLPWRTNFENMVLPLEIQGKDEEEIRRQAESIKSLFAIDIDWEGYPYGLSGGQQQVLVFMRALITRPRVLLIDEPFSALDYENNLLLRECLQRYFLAFGPTVLLITHNVEEAVHLAGKVFIFSRSPTRVLEEAHNSMPYPRTIESLKSEQFHQVRSRTLQAFQEAVHFRI